MTSQWLAEYPHCLGTDPKDLTLGPPKKHLGKYVPSGNLTYWKYWKSQFLTGKSTINGPCSIAMLVYQRIQRLVLSAKTPSQRAAWSPFLTVLISCCHRCSGAHEKRSEKRTRAYHHLAQRVQINTSAEDSRSRIIAGCTCLITLIPDMGIKKDPKMEVLYHIRPYSVGIYPT